MTDFLEVDFCKGRALRVARRFDVSDGIESGQLAGATSLGCNFPVSHRADSAPGTILSRVSKQSGKDVSDLLTSADESNFANPGPTSYLIGAPDVFLSGNVSLPFPAARPVVTDVLAAGGGEVGRFVATAGFGNGAGFRPMVVVPPGDTEYVDPGPLANHRALRRFKTVSSPNPHEAYGLVYRNQIIDSVLVPKYVWSSTFGNSEFRTSDDGTTDWEHSFFFVWYGTPPALVGYQEPVETPVVDVAPGFGIGQTVSTNGPAQGNRKYSHPIVAGIFTGPDFNETVEIESTLTGTRPMLTIFSQSGFDDAFGYDVLTFNGQNASFTPVTLPSDQYVQNLNFGFPEENGFSQGIFKPSPTSQQNFQVYGIIDQAMSIDIPINQDSIEVAVLPINATNPTPATFTMDLPKNIGQTAWMEMWIFVRSRHVGTLP